MMALFNDEYIQNAFGREKYNEGRDEGTIEQARKTALYLHTIGMSNDVISKATGFSDHVVASWIAKAPV